MDVDYDSEIESVVVDGQPPIRVQPAFSVRLKRGLHDYRSLGSCGGRNTY